MLLQQVLDKATENRTLQIVAGDGAPPNGEIPNRDWFSLDELTNLEDGMPTWIRLTIRRWNSRQDRLRVSDRFANSLETRLIV
jgi:hypothetical protein